jgi:hypothetical protein
MSFSKNILHHGVSTIDANMKQSESVFIKYGKYSYALRTVVVICIFLSCILTRVILVSVTRRVHDSL